MKTALLTHKDDEGRPWGIQLNQVQVPNTFSFSPEQEAGIAYLNLMVDKATEKDVKEFCKLLFWNVAAREKMIKALMRNV